MKSILRNSNFFLPLVLLIVVSSIASNPTTAIADMQKRKLAVTLDAAAQKELKHAVELGRRGKYDDALNELKVLHQNHPMNEKISRDYVAILSWAAHDDEAIKLYETLPPVQPDYVLAAVGHSYRAINKPEKALMAYKLGIHDQPENVTFAEGIIWSLADLKKYDEANAFADEDMHFHGARKEIVTAKANILRAQYTYAHNKAVQLGRDEQYNESLAIFRAKPLDAEQTTDIDIRRDYMTVLGWAGGHDREVQDIYGSMNGADQPDYVLLAAAKAYRNTRQPDQALAIYRFGMEKFPGNSAFRTGEIFALLDLKRSDEADRKIHEFEKTHSGNSEMEGLHKNLTDFQLIEERSQAAALARSGHHQEALAMLQKLGRQHKNDAGIKQDRLLITGWLGDRDQSVIDQYKALKNTKQPDYVLEAVAKAYYNLGQHDKASAIYQKALKRFPKNEDFAAGSIRGLADEGYIVKANKLAKDNLKRYGNRLQVLIAAGDAANMYDQPEALHYFQAAAKIAPKNLAVIQGLIVTADRTGAPQVALKAMQQNPGLITDPERRRIEGDAAAALVRVGKLEQQEKNSYTTTDKAIDLLDNHIARWQQEGPGAEKDIARAKFDRILAYANRGRPSDVLNEYEQLQQTGGQIPAYVLNVVGDAYQSAYQPEQARDAYLKALDSEPNNYATRKQLFYAYTDLGDYENAYAMADSLAGLKNSSKTGTLSLLSKEQMVDAELTSAAARLYFGEITEADKKLLPLIETNPEIPEVQEAAGNLANAHGVPREALQHYEQGKVNAGGTSLGNEVGIADTEFALHNFKQALADTDALLARYPNNHSVLRLKRESDIYQKAELDIRGGYSFEPMTSHEVNGGEAFGIDTRIYSSPINYNWRLFADKFYAHQKEPNDEGSIGYLRGTVGAEYRNGPLTANLMPTINLYKDSERLGIAADASYGLDDYWTVAAGGESFSRDIPLRALNQGVTASAASAHAVWRQDETRSIRFGGSAMSFSDGNLRTEEDVDLTQRLSTQPALHIDGLVSLGAGQNSKDENRSYYNPGQDVIGFVGAKVTQTLYQRYDTLWEHSLQFTPGVYWQSDFDTSAVIRARYEHRLHFNDTFEAGIGLNYSHQAYDGQAEDDFRITFDLVDRF